MESVEYEEQWDQVFKQVVFEKMISVIRNGNFSIQIIETEEQLTVGGASI